MFKWSTFQCFTSFHIHVLPTSPPETARVTRNCESHLFIICVWLGVQHLELICYWNAKPVKPASWRNSNGNRFVFCAFCAPWTSWIQTGCFPRTFLATRVLLMSDDHHCFDILSTTIQGLQVLHYRPWMLGSEIENPNQVLETFLITVRPSLRVPATGGARMMSKN